jgi:hypothetical protein
VTKYNKLQLCGLAARMDTNIHKYIFAGTYNGIQKKIGWKCGMETPLRSRM